MGRWGFTDRAMYQMGGKPTEPSRLENAWLLKYKGTPGRLGRLLSEVLNIQEVDKAKYAPLFEIVEVEPSPTQPKPPTILQ